MTEPKSLRPKIFLVIVRVVHLLYDFSSLIEAAEEFFVFFEAVEVFDYLLEVLMFQAIPVVEPL
jgi:hypothetical protein